MKSGTALLAILFASASFPLLAQQPAQPGTPATQQNPPSTAPAPQAPQTQAPQSPAASPEMPAVAMSPVDAELETKLDSKTAKAGDNVVVRTKSTVKTADGTEIPKGSKLVGHVIGVQPSGAGTNSQVALQFDHVELKGGQNLAVHSQIQSIAPPEGAASAGSGPSSAASGAMNPPPSGASSSSSGTNSGLRTNGTPQGATAETGATPPAHPGVTPTGNGGPVAGTVVAQNGNIAIRTTAIPGVLLANNAAGQQDPRMAKVSSILLGAKRDIQLDGGTQMVVGLSASGGGAQ